MNATTVAVDLAKKVFEIAVADTRWHVVDRARLTRAQFERWFDNRNVDLIVMEACGSAHYWGRLFRERGIEVKLLPAQYVRAYVKRNKTDAADAAALLEAARAGDIKPVAVKSVEQQALQALHRTREAWKSTRTRRINTRCADSAASSDCWCRKAPPREPHRSHAMSPMSSPASPRCCAARCAYCSKRSG